MIEGLETGLSSDIAREDDGAGGWFSDGGEKVQEGGGERENSKAEKQTTRKEGEPVEFYMPKE